MDKLFVIVLSVGGLLIAGLSTAVFGLWQHGGKLAAEKSALVTSLEAKEAELFSANADLAMSKLNATRVAREKDALIATLLDQQTAQRADDEKAADITKDIASVANSDLCIKSPPVRAALRGLGRLHLREAPAALANGPADSGVPPDAHPGGHDALPKGPRSARRGYGG